MKYEDVIKQLQHQQYAPVYVLYGDEAFYIDKVADYIEEHLLDEASKAFDQTVIYGKDLQGDDISQAVSAARGFPMMGEKKLVMVKEAQTVRKWEALGMYASNPQPSTVLVICHKHGSPDKRLSAFKNIEKAGGIMMQSDKLRDYQLAPWIKQYMESLIKEKGLSVTIDPRVPQLIADSIGSDLNTIASAINKLIVGLPPEGRTIDFALVERNVGISKDYNIFELQAALIQGDVVKANRITKYFAESKDHPMVKELGVLYNFFANLMIYHYLPDKNERTVAAALGIPPFFVKDYTAAARRFSAGKTFSIISYFRETDARSKGINNPSAGEDDLWKELIYKILH